MGHLLKRRAAGFLRSDKIAALFTKVGKVYDVAGEICRKVQEQLQQHADLTRSVAQFFPCRPFRVSRTLNLIRRRCNGDKALAQCLFKRPFCPHVLVHCMIHSFSVPAGDHTLTRLTESNLCQRSESGLLIREALLPDSTHFVMEDNKTSQVALIMRQNIN